MKSFHLRPRNSLFLLLCGVLAAFICIEMLSLISLSVTRERPVHVYERREETMQQPLIGPQLAMLNGFLYCKRLENALVFADALVMPKQDFVRTVDERAAALAQSMTALGKLDATELRMSVCYEAMEEHKGVLHSLDPDVFFQHLVQYKSIPGPRFERSFRMAYLVTVYLESEFDNLVHLLDQLNDEHALLLIHVDASAPSYYDKVKQHVAQRPLGQFIHVTEHRTANVWGHVSFLYTMLNGMFQLRDMASWDYLVLLSEHDFPLRKNTQVHAILDQKRKARIDMWDDEYDFTLRFTYAWYLTDTLELKRSLKRRTMPLKNGGACKAHYWHIATPDVVDFLRTDAMAIRFLAFSINVLIPYEHYLCALMRHDQQFSNLFEQSGLRWVHFQEGAPEPDTFTLQHAKTVLKRPQFQTVGTQVIEYPEPEHLFVRRVFMNQQPELLSYLTEFIQDASPIRSS